MKRKIQKYKIYVKYEVCKTQNIIMVILNYDFESQYQDYRQ